MLNIRLIPATVATAGKYSKAALYSQQNGEIPYPLVSGTDLYNHDLIVPLHLKSTDGVEMYFPEAVVNVSRVRNIVATPVLNGKGTVKELITDGDLELSLSLAVVSTFDDDDYDGSMLAANDVYPYKGVERLRKLLDAQERLDVVSDFLTLFDLDSGNFGIVVKSYSVHQDTHMNRQVFEVQAVSDYDYELLIKE